MNVYPQVSGPDPDRIPVLAGLIDQLRERHGDAVDAVLAYGSCLRSGDIFDGLLDLYLVVESYRTAHGPTLAAAANYLLPPNVYYAQRSAGDQTLRCKVTVISRADFASGCSRRWFQSYIWGRFAQPTCIIYYRSARVKAEIEESLLDASHSLLHSTLPALPAGGTVADLWVDALALSYGTELRTERPGRARELVMDNLDYYRQLTQHHVDSLALPLKVYDAGKETRYRCDLDPARRRRSALAWAARRVQGKLLSIMRLVKALFTFEGGLDYIAWKLERHSGEQITIPERVRRFPLLFMWPFFWRLYRRGVFK